MKAAKAADFAAMLPGSVGVQSGATQAYTQAYLTGSTTYVRPPQARVASLVARNEGSRLQTFQALYGQPDSGGFWD
eukprot:2741465-Alexandrium_andersonii.AAC.1